MTREEFEAAGRAADVLRHTSDPVNAEFWMGYLRGLRRHFHGEHFGTPEEHALWSRLADEQGDDARQARGIGYRCGVVGTPIAEAMTEAQLLRVVDGGGKIA